MRRIPPNIIFYTMQEMFIAPVSTTPLPATGRGNAQNVCIFNQIDTLFCRSDLGRIHFLVRIENTYVQFSRSPLLFAFPFNFSFDKPQNKKSSETTSGVYSKYGGDGCTAVRQRS